MTRSDAPERKLWCAVLEGLVYDARSADRKIRDTARYQLKTPHFAYLLGEMGVDLDAMRQALR